MPTPEFSPSQKNESVYREILSLQQIEEKMKTVPFQSVAAIDAFFKLVRKIGNGLSTYDTILSDDASGRLVSLVLRDVIKEARKRKGIKDEVHTYFLASGRHERQKVTKAIEDFVKNKKSEIKNALVVTEHIATGKSIMQLVNILNKIGINYNIASLSTSERLGLYPMEVASRLYVGISESRAGASFYDKPDYAGVDKYDFIDSPHPNTRGVRGHPRDIALARQDASMLAEELKKIIV